ncbi:MAG: DUF362 domain-containing protein [Rhodopseudomonas palustris]|nr:DUF362 domain-containing protein [Rhodopseudomonas palustris]
MWPSRCREGRRSRRPTSSRSSLPLDVLINVSVAKHHEGTEFACVLKNAMGALTYGHLPVLPLRPRQGRLVRGRGVPVAVRGGPQSRCENPTSPSPMPRRS